MPREERSVRKRAARLKRASYRHAIAWIAENDEGLEMDPETVALSVTALLVADLFGADPERVGRAIVRYRRIHLLTPQQLKSVARREVWP